MTLVFNNTDRRRLRELASRVAENASRPEVANRRQRWMAHNALQLKEPLMLIFPEGAWEELILPGDLCCEDLESREIEWELLRRLYTFEHFKDDSVIEAEWVVEGEVHDTGWGLDPVKAYTSERRGAFAIQPVLREQSDIKKLRFPELVYDMASHLQRLEAMQGLFGDILNVKRKGVTHISYHLWSQYLYLRGESAYLTDFIDAPDMLEEVMTLFTEGYKRLLKEMIERNLLSLNNDNTYHSSGGNGYIAELPAEGFDPQRVRPCDLWASAESQELAGVSPRMHLNFAMKYERELLEPFGLTGYGCCEDLSRKIDDVLELPHMRRVSISPFADVERSAEKMKGRAIFSWKPQPAQLAGTIFEPELVRRYIRNTLNVCQINGCILEIILKDTHTCQQNPERFETWTHIAREEIQAVS
jgi:hypothetical protein